MPRSLLVLSLACSAVAAEAGRIDTRPFLNLPPALDESGTGLPTLLSQTGAFADTASLRSAPGVLAYEVIQPLWSDGALKQRWLAVPGGQRIGFASDDPWSFPVGTVFVKHFSMPRDLRQPEGPQRRLETRLLAVRPGGEVYGVTYRWRVDNSDADLVEADGASEELQVIGADGNPRTQTWNFPAREACNVCHTPESKGVLGVHTRQLNRSITGGQQLAVLARHGWLDRPLSDADCAKLPRLSAFNDRNASREERLRSYFDANCANCHHPASQVGSGTFHLDLRHRTPLAQQGLINVPVANNLGIDGATTLTPGHPELSVLHARVSRRDEFGMPPLGSTVVDTAFVEELRAWIASLPATSRETTP